MFFLNLSPQQKLGLFYYPNFRLKMTAEEQDEYLLDVLNALEESNKNGSIEVPHGILESDELFLNWVKSL